MVIRAALRARYGPVMCIIARFSRSASDPPMA
jgi:hypothetical protein